MNTIKTQLFHGPGARILAETHALEHGGISRPPTSNEIESIRSEYGWIAVYAVDTGAIDPLERDDVRRVLDMITVRNANGDEIAHYDVCYLVLAHALDQTEAPSDLYIDWELSSSRTRVEGNYNRISTEDKQTIWDAAIRAIAAAAIYDDRDPCAPLIPPMSAGALCERLADVFDCQHNQRQHDLAQNLRKLASILGTRHTASALRTRWRIGAQLASSQGDTERMIGYLELLEKPVEQDAHVVDPVGAMHVIVDLLAFYARRAEPEDVFRVALLRHELAEAVARVEHAMIKMRAVIDR